MMVEDFCHGLHYEIPFSLRMQALARYMNMTTEQLGEIPIMKLIRLETEMILLGTMG